MTKPTKQEFHIRITADNKTALDYLANASGISRQKLKQIMQKGCVWLERVKTEVIQDKLVDVVDPELDVIADVAVPVPLDGIDESEAIKKKEQTQQAYIQRLRRAKKVLTQGDILHFYYDESVLDSDIARATLVKDFGDYSVWNKPSGMLSQGSKWGDHCTVYRWVEKNLQPERAAFIVHRLDRAANGLIIVAHKKRVASQFGKMFERREIEKYYQVKVTGDFSKMITSEDGVLTINDKIDDKAALSFVTLLSLDSKDNVSTLQVQIETGRKHQIRKHLLGLGYPVMGDRLYGADNASDSVNKGDQLQGDLQLQAKTLKFNCPITAESRAFTLDS